MIVQSDARHIPLADESVHCVVTSPPYWGLRDYGTGAWQGGNRECQHIRAEIRTGLGLANLGERYRGGGHKQGSIPSLQYGQQCGVCGAVRSNPQLSLEPTPEEYVANMVAVFREVRRVLRRDGTLWLNLGDSYATGAGAVGKCPGGGKQGDRWVSGLGPVSQPNRMPQAGLKPKDLVGIPWRVAFALQADGWWLRSDIIWSKPNPMPESVTDRPTKAHEYVFLLAKSEKYFFDGEAIAEPVSDSTTERWGKGGKRSAGLDDYFIKRDGGKKHIGQLGSTGMPPNRIRNRRTVWEIPTQPYSGAHFATFPEALVQPCIAAGTRERDIVFDPFAGSGTVGRVAFKMNRRFILADLKYHDLMRERIPPMAEVLLSAARSSEVENARKV
jgi:DNA modification methylase